MTRNTDRLDMLARDLASRYGEEDRLVRAIRSDALPQPLAHGLGHWVWKISPKHSFKHARLARLGIASAA